MIGVHLATSVSMRQINRVNLFVGLVVCTALSCGWWLYSENPSFPGPWELACFIVVAFLLDQAKTQLKVGAHGSTSFVIHMAAGMLFGGFWGGTIAAVSTGLGLLAIGTTPQKLLFNVSQRGLAVMLAALFYQALGGGTPPAYLAGSDHIRADSLQYDLVLFFAYAACYFAVNTIAVIGVVSLSTGKSFKDVYNLNARGVLGYDLGASGIALLVTWLYGWASHRLGLGSVGLLIGAVPIVVVRHIYGLYHQLQDSGQELLQVMVKAIEARDPYTSGHSLRVSELSRTIASELGLSTREIEQVETAALLHDVGKIHEEFAPLLRKESRLTEEETALMQTHSTKSAELVGIISKFRGFIQDSVRHHHERWDGQGYPAGLSAKNIPLGSRIILVSDTIDAMTTDRPYRKRLPLEVVIAELQKCKGTQFDPDLVDVVVSSVVVRRLITGPSAEIVPDSTHGRSRRVSWPAGGIWRARRA
jgi:putative nucleotidyltransferase with HDIG domain